MDVFYAVIFTCTFFVSLILVAAAQCVSDPDLTVERARGFLFSQVHMYRYARMSLWTDDGLLALFFEL